MRAAQETNGVHSESGTAAVRPARAAAFARWIKGPTFARDIAFVLALKVVLLITLKLAFFNHPRAADMTMPPAQVAQALFSSPASRVPQGVGHAQ